MRVRHKGGQENLSLEPDMTLGAFAALLSEKVGVPATRLVIKFGYPLKPLTGGNGSAALNTVFSSGESLTVEDGDAPSVLVESAPVSASAGDPASPAPAVASGPESAGTGSAPVVKRPDAPVAAPPVNSSGVGVRRVVDADNTCLFASFAYVFHGKDRKKGMPLRKLVADEILADPVNYNDAVLGQDPKAYAAWIQGPEHWGGAIELAVLADHYSTQIVAWDIQTLRPLRFGEGKGYKQCVHLVYDGIHYDALALSILEDVPPESEDFDITVFSPEDRYMETQAVAVVTKLNQAKKFTDTGSFTLRCLVCQKGLVGEADAVEHAKATGHQNFAEYR